MELIILGDDILGCIILKNIWIILREIAFVNQDARFGAMPC